MNGNVERPGGKFKVLRSIRARNRKEVEEGCMDGHDLLNLKHRNFWVGLKRT